MTKTFRSVSADKIVRGLAEPHERLSRAWEAFRALLDEVATQLGGMNVAVDAAVPVNYVGDARLRFADRALFALLRIDYETWRHREDRRADRAPISWDDSLARTVLSQAGDDSTYDLVVDTSSATPDETAGLILDAVR